MARKRTVQYVATLALAASLPVFTFAGSNRGNKQQQPPPPPTSSTSSEMSSTVIDKGGLPNAAGLDVLGQPCTAYFAGSELKFAVFNGAGWVIQSLGALGGDYGASSVDMAVDASGRPTIVYSVPWERGTNNNHLWVTSYDGSAWKTGSLGLFSWAPSIAIGPDGTKYIAYVASGTSGSVLKVAESIGTGWAISTADESNVASGIREAYSPSIAVDQAGNPAVVYGYFIHGVSKQARYAYRASGVWQVKSIFNDIALSTDLAFDATNRPAVAFWAASGSLRMMYSDGGTGWSSYLLPWSGGIAGEISLLLDNSGTAFMSVFDGGASDLRLISGRPGNYVNQLVSATGTVGKSNSLVINKSTGQKRLTFSDESGGVLRLVGF